MNVAGIIIGVACFVIIGVFHPVVILCEYYFSARVWPLFLILGVLFCALSLMISDDVLSGIVGVVGFCLLWSIHELRKQEERVAKGWFPRNPKRKTA